LNRKYHKVVETFLEVGKAFGRKIKLVEMSITHINEE